MNHIERLALGTYAEITNGIASRGKAKQWERVALVFFNEEGDPRAGEEMRTDDICDELGMSKYALWSAISRCRDHGLAIISGRVNGACSAGYYKLAQTRQEYAKWVTHTQKDISGRAGLLGQLIDLAPDDWGEIKNQSVLPMTADNMQTLFGEMGLRMAARLLDDEQLSLPSGDEDDEDAIS